MILGKSPAVEIPGLSRRICETSGWQSNRWNADSVDPHRHQCAIHHETRCASVSVKEKPLKRSEQEKRRCPLEWI
jgi:hypothetical protein